MSISSKMFSLKQFLQAPTYDDSKLQTRSLLLSKILQYYLIFAILWTLVRLIVEPSPLALVNGASSVLIVGVTQYFNHRHNQDIATWFLLISLYFVFSYFLIIGGGFEGNFYPVYMLILILSVFLLDRKYTLLLSIICVLTGFVVAIIQSNGNFPESRLPITVISRYIGQTVILLVPILIFLLHASVREQSEEALLNSEALRSTILENSNDGIVSINEDGIILDTNKALLDMFGYDEDELVGKKVNLLMPSPYNEGHDMYMSNYMETRIPKIIGVGRELVAMKKDRSIFPIYLSVAQIEMNGSIIFSGSIRDITLQKEAEAVIRRSHEELEFVVHQRTSELERSNKDLESFAHIVSHDLQEPLRNTKKYVQLFEKRYKGEIDNKADKYISFAIDGVNRMQTLIKDILKYSTIDSLDTELEEIELDNLIGEVIKSLDVVITENDAVISFTKLPRVKAIRTLLFQVFQNIILNSIKYRRELSPEITISVEKRKRVTLISIEDNGAGIESKYLERIFQAFQRGSSSSGTKGTGIGLASSKKIIEKHGGRIWVESTVGEGSTFFFTLAH